MAERGSDARADRDGDGASGRRRIGQRKFAYDLWGDTVNTAARLESNGVPDEIQVSEAVYRQLGDRYLFSDVHVVILKGKGPTAARFLLGKNGTA